jgi:hypothetical protein
MAETCVEIIALGLHWYIFLFLVTITLCGAVESTRYFHLFIYLFKVSVY